MVEESVFRGIIEFFAKVGIYDVVLPFLLVFSIVFAILEKTRIFGVEEVGEAKYTKKNLNAMVAFVVGFLVVASTRLVAVVNVAIANIALLLIVVVCFLMLIGVFFSHKEDVMLDKGPWRTTFMIIMALGVLLIFMNALGWLFPFINYLGRYWHTNVVGAILLLLMIVVFMWWVAGGKGSEAGKSTEKKEE